ncbi:hypothetical protein [Flavobacterium sp.]|uniref:hypothetical protein n=1 Tax=Flavobacterium sp. TaxID=239 RepID=UPI0037522997
MKLKLICFLLLSIVLISCKDDTVERLAEQKKEAQKKEKIFDRINQGWTFVTPNLQATTQSKVSNWLEWRAFLIEINQKPKASIGAFQKKAKVLSKKVMELNNNIPPEFNTPPIKSRITVLTTKIKAMDLFIHLNQIPDKKVLKFVDEINVEIMSLQLQMEEITTRSLIPMEDGEPDIIRMKDTSRAIPTTTINDLP